MKAFPLALAGALALAGPIDAPAQPYPARPITFVVPFAPGGATDTLARQFAERMSGGGKHAIIIENTPGAGGTVGATRVARAKADGYTFLIGHVGYMAAAPGLYKQLAYDPVQDFDAVARFPDTPMVLIAGRNNRLTDIRVLDRTCEAQSRSRQCSERRRRIGRPPRRSVVRKRD